MTAPTPGAREPGAHRRDAYRAPPPRAAASAAVARPGLRGALQRRRARSAGSPAAAPARLALRSLPPRGRGRHRRPRRARRLRCVRAGVAADGRRRGAGRGARSRRLAARRARASRGRRAALARAARARGALRRRGLRDRRRRAAAGRADSPLQPLVYLVMAFLVAFLARRVGLALVALAVALELLVWHGAGRPRGRAPRRDRARRVRDAVRRAVPRRPRRPARRGEARRSAGGGAPAARRSTIARASFASGLRGRDVGAGRRRGAGRGAPSWRWRRDARRARGRRGRAPEPHLRGVPAGRGRASELALRECRSAERRGRARASRRGEGALGGAVARRTSVRLHGEIKVASYYEDGTPPGRAARRAARRPPRRARARRHRRGPPGARAVLGRGREARRRRSAPRSSAALEAERVMGDIKTHARREGRASTTPSSGSTGRRSRTRCSTRAREGRARDGAGRLRGGDASSRVRARGGCTASVAVPR